jgi:hypothetical protein
MTRETFIIATLLCSTAAAEPLPVTFLQQNKSVRHHDAIFKKKACGSGVVRVMAQMSIFLGNSGKTAERRWHTDIDRRSLVWKILSGARLSRREEALPVSCES